MITIFNFRGCSAAEDLADETINRAIRQLSSIEDSYEGDPAKYLHGITRFVALEYFNRQVLIFLESSIHAAENRCN